MSIISKNPNKYHRRRRDLEKKLNENKTESESNVIRESVLESLEILKMDEDLVASRENSPEFKINNLEYDLRTTDWILEKARDSEIYSQNLYAALCNNSFAKIDIADTPENVVKVLKDGRQKWHCSWRYAGGIISDMRQSGDYMDWYCSGIRNIDYEDDINSEWDNKKYVAEAVVTDEIRQDLKKLGWVVVDEDDNS